MSNLLLSLITVVIRGSATRLTFCFVVQVLANGFLINQFEDSILGADIEGVDIEKMADVQLFDSIHSALINNKVLAIRNQFNLTTEGLRLFSNHFGVLRVHMDSTAHHPNYSDVNYVSNMKNSSGHHIGLHGTHVETFHSDLSWHHLPVKITILHSLIRPEGCGDTHFIDTHAAYDALNDTMKKTLAGLKGLYSYLKLQGDSAVNNEQAWTEEDKSRAVKPSVHPIITVHPVTGRRNIFANPTDTVSIIGMDKGESDRILSFLFAHIEQMQFRYVHSWRDSDLVLWDNRALQHRGSPCPDHKPRKLQRTLISNDDVPRDEVAVLSWQRYSSSDYGEL